MENKKEKVLVVVHSSNDIGLYDRETLAKITHSRENNDFRKMEASHPQSQKTFNSLEALLKNIEANPGSKDHFMPYAIWFSSENLLDELSPKCKNATETLYVKYQVPIGTLGTGNRLKELLHTASGEEITVTKETTAHPENVVFFSYHDADGKSKELYLTLKTSEDEVASRHYHFPFNSDSESALSMLAEARQGHPVLVPQKPANLAKSTRSMPEQDKMELGNGPWMTYGKSVELSSANLFTSSRIWINPYRLNNNDPRHEYYLFMINYSHGVNHFKQDCGTVGFYGHHMNLDIEFITPDSKLYNWGPNTIVGEANVGFTIGGGLKGGKDKDGFAGEVSLDASFSVSFTIPEVNITATPRYRAQSPVQTGEGIKWDFTLPKVGWVSPAVPANPGMAAKGFICYPCFIMQVPKGQDPEFRIKPDIKWTLDSPRGIAKNTQTWDTATTLKFTGLE